MSTQPHKLSPAQMGKIAHSKKRQAQGRYLLWFRNTGDPAVALKSVVELGVTQMRVNNWKRTDAWFRARYDEIETAEKGKAEDIIKSARVKAAQRYVGLLDAEDPRMVEKAAKTILLSEGVLTDKREPEEQAGGQVDGQVVEVLRKTYTVEELRVLVSKTQQEALPAPIVLDAEQ